MKKYDYLVERSFTPNEHEIGDETSQLQAWLDNFGAHGWRLVATLYSDMYHLSQTIFIFERETEGG